MKKNTMKNTGGVVASAAPTTYDSLPNLLLTEHFNLREFVISGTAIRHRIDNTPPEDAVRNIRALCVNVLEPLRRRFGVIRITSGYRAASVNALVGGATTSQHLRGEAADIHVASMEVGKKMYDYILRNLPFDQLIMEHRKKTGARWIHVSYTTRHALRGETLTIMK